MKSKKTLILVITMIGLGSIIPVYPAASRDSILLEEIWDGDWSTTNPPPGWTIKYDPPPGNSDWHRHWDGFGYGTASMRSNPYENGIDELISPANDCSDSSYDKIYLITEDDYAQDPNFDDIYTAKVLGSTDDGATFPHLIADWTNTDHDEVDTIDLTDWALGESKVKVNYYGEGNSAWHAGWWNSLVRIKIHRNDVLPDNLIKNEDDASYLGDNVYNTDGTNQTKSQQVDAGSTAIYHIKAQNDSTCRGSFVISGTAGNSDWSVKYYDALSGGNEVTSQVTGSGWNIYGVESGQFKEFRAEVTPSSAVAGDSSFDITVTTTSFVDDNVKDVVKATTTTNEYKPDNLIKRQNEGGYLGDDVYNADGTDQTLKQYASYGVIVVDNIKIENDGNTSDSYTVTDSQSGLGWTVTYYDALQGGNDITSQVTGIGWSTPELEAGAYKEIRMELLAEEPADTSFEVLVTSTSNHDDTKVDAVKALTFITSAKVDALIKHENDSGYIGNNIYNLDGTDQTAEHSGTADSSSIFYIKAQNDLNDPTITDNLVITGDEGNSDWQVKYFEGIGSDIDITEYVTGTGWSTGELGEGESKEITLEITPSPDLPDGSEFEVLVTVTSSNDEDEQDAVKAKRTIGIPVGVEEDYRIKKPDVVLLGPSILRAGLTRIRYGIPIEGYLDISLYDVSGKKVKRIYSGETASGIHSLLWNPHGLSPGVYFYNLSIGSKFITRKIILID